VTARRLSLASVVLYAVAWVVPVAETSGELLGGTTWGWQAPVFAISPLFGSHLGPNGLVQVLMVASALTNLLYLLVVVRAVRTRQAKSWALAWSLVGASVLNAFWIVLPDLARDLRVGYYLWWVAFPIMAASVFVGSPTVRPDLQEG